MKLYYAPGACSLSPHIVLCELKLPHELEKVDLKTHTLKSGADYHEVNPKGYVPALQLDDGLVLTEVTAVVQYLADLKPRAKLLPHAGTLERARVQEWLGFISSEIHKSFSPMFRPSISDDWKDALLANIARRFEFIEESLIGRDYLMGADFTVADAYLFTIISWAPMMEIDLALWPRLQAYQQRVAARPAVQEAMRAEGLIS